MRYEMLAQRNREWFDKQTAEFQQSMRETAEKAAALMWTTTDYALDCLITVVKQYAATDRRNRVQT